MSMGKPANFLLLAAMFLIVTTNFAACHSGARLVAAAGRAKSTMLSGATTSTARLNFKGTPLSRPWTDPAVRAYTRTPRDEPRVAFSINTY